jgi:hypothetical protein
MANREKYHITKNGKKIKLSDLELDHLKNIIRWIENKSIKGMLVKYGGGSCAEDFYYDEEILYGDSVKYKLNYEDYISELKNRNANV